MDNALGNALTVEARQLLDEVKVFQKHRPVRSSGLRILIIAHGRTGILCHQRRRSECSTRQQSHNTKYWEHAHDEVSPYSNFMSLGVAETRHACGWPPRVHSAARLRM